MLSKFIEVMQSHIGRDCALSGKELAQALEIAPREVRHLTDAVIDHGILLCSHPAYGYWIALNADELEATCQFHRGRALHELSKEAKLRKVGLGDLLGQMHLRT